MLLIGHQSTRADVTNEVKFTKLQNKSLAMKTSLESCSFLSCFDAKLSHKPFASKTITCNRFKLKFLVNKLSLGGLSTREISAELSGEPRSRRVVYCLAEFFALRLNNRVTTF